MLGVDFGKNGGGADGKGGEGVGGPQRRGIVMGK
jgi:hypothetical protein